MNVIIRDLDKTRIHYEAALHRVGNKMANKAFARALNAEGAKIRTDVKTATAKQAGVKVGTAGKAIKGLRASSRRMSYIIEAKGSRMSLRHFPPLSQFSYGAKAKPWGKSRTFPHAFLIAKYDNNAFIRVAGYRRPFRNLYGPSIPEEMVEGRPLMVFEKAQPLVLKEATRQLDLMLAGKIK